MTENRYNLIDEAWIPAADHGKVSLRRVFEDEALRALGGTPVHKIALLKFLLAVAQAAATPADDDAWLTTGPQGMAAACLAYLEQHREAFRLYGSQPFLQMPACMKAEPKSYGAAMPETAFGNTTLLTDLQLEPEPDDAAKALLLLTQMNLCLGGKKPFNRLVLTPGYEKKASSHPGPSICYSGLLHSFLSGRTLQETLWLNLLTREDIAGQKQWEHGPGTPPWEVMPQGEDCPAARALKSSLMGRLVGLARFCLLTSEGLRFTEGIVHPDYMSGMVDPSAAIDASGSKPRMLWTDPEKRPWRRLPALLSFLDASSPSGFHCLGLRKGLARVKRTSLETVGIWCGGVKVSSNAGEQYLTGTDDVVESEAWFCRTALESGWFASFRGIMEKTEHLASLVYGTTRSYWAAMKVQDKSHAERASGRFWQLVEPTFQTLIDGCDRTEAAQTLLRKYRAAAIAVYDEACPHGTSRQFEQWIRHRPFSGRK